jgi:hypothetical protein
MYTSSWPPDMRAKSPGGSQALFVWTGAEQQHQQPAAPARRRGRAAAAEAAAAAAARIRARAQRARCRRLHALSFLAAGACRVPGGGQAQGAEVGGAVRARAVTLTSARALPGVDAHRSIASTPVGSGSSATNAGSISAGKRARHACPRSCLEVVLGRGYCPQPRPLLLLLLRCCLPCMIMRRCSRLSLAGRLLTPAAALLLRLLRALLLASCPRSHVSHESGRVRRHSIGLPMQT